MDSAINLYYVNGLFNPTDHAEGITLGTAPGSITFIQSLHASSALNISAHEIGHALGLRHPEYYAEAESLTTDRLMKSADLGGDPCRLIQHEWLTANGTAQ